MILRKLQSLLRLRCYRGQAGILESASRIRTRGNLDLYSLVPSYGLVNTHIKSRSDPLGRSSDTELKDRVLASGKLFESLAIVPPQHRSAKILYITLSVGLVY